MTLTPERWQRTRDVVLADRSTSLDTKWLPGKNFWSRIFSREQNFTQFPCANSNLTTKDLPGTADLAWAEKLFAMEAAQPRTGSGSRTKNKEPEESKTTAGRKGNRG